jgi:hypothetical protein
MSLDFYDIKKIAIPSSDDLSKHCSNSELALENSESSCTDIDRDDDLPETMDALHPL